jgi:hypothetical protein
MKPQLLRPATASTLMAWLVDSPDSVRTVRPLPAQTFSAVVRHIGVADAGELIALATTEQLVAAFDEDLFVNAEPGERETFDGARFVVWLEVLLEAGDDVAARRVAELSEDFVVQALSSIVLVLDHDALVARMSRGGHDAAQADKAIESALSEEIDGYLLLSRKHDGWDAALALILALDRDHRPLLVRVLDRCAELASGYIDDLDELSTVLSVGDSIAEDVEAEREERRSRLGYVEPRAARSFLALAGEPLPTDVERTERDPITRAYFRDLERPAAIAHHRPAGAEALLQLRGAAADVDLALRALPASTGEHGPSEKSMALVEAMRLLSDREPQAFSERMNELVYLANVLFAGAGTAERRLRRADAAEAALATVALGAEIVARQRRPVDRDRTAPTTPNELCELLRSGRADLLFRAASSALVAQKQLGGGRSFVRSRTELEQILLEH